MKDEKVTAYATLLLALGTNALAVFSRIQIDDFREQGKRQLRPYVFLAEQNGQIENPPIITKIMNFTEGQVIDAHIQITNFGQTPAYDFRVNGTVDVLAKPLPIDVSLITTDTEAPSTLAPHASIFNTVLSKKAVTPDDRKSVREGSRAIYVYGRIPYIDIWGIFHYTDFCMWYGTDPNFPTSCDRHNDSDRN